ncbi:MAG TPA: hypothetical protein VMU86_02665 [Steroidobacteraceae bacterium]|nr:hypothetical protein [Steroidobacteraceae bacterium]
MKAHARVVVGLWLIALALAAVLAARAHYVADLSALLPAHPAPGQRLLGDLVRAGPAEKTILLAIEGGTAADRAHASRELVTALRRTRDFSTIDNGGPGAVARARRFIFEHRYALSDAVTPAHFTARALRRSIGRSIDDLATPAGPWLEALLPRDPTGEAARIIDRIGAGGGPNVCDGVWCSRSGRRALLMARTRASGSDTDGQARAIAAIDAAFRAIPGAAPTLRLRSSGPPVFAVAARARIERTAARLSILAGVCIVALLFTVYRSLAAVLLGLLPVATAALVGVAAVAVAFGTVQGLTLGFGATLIGEAVDYSIYFFLQSADCADSWRQRYWPTVRLGALTSICGFAALLASGFPGLEQLGVYSIAGLVAAAATTRFVLPQLAPRPLRIRAIAPLGLALRARLPAPRIARAVLAAVAIGSLIALAKTHGVRWSHDLAALSPVPSADRRLDTTLRAGLGAADVRDVVVARGADRESALRAAEVAGKALDRLTASGVIGGFENPSDYLPSLATQRQRRLALPDPSTLIANLRRAIAGLPLRERTLAGFVADVEAARRAPALTPQDLAGTPLAAAFDALLLRRHGRWIALLPLRAPLIAGRPGRIDLSQVRTALGGSAEAFDLRAGADAVYAAYLRNALRASAAGFLAITILLVVARRSPGRTLRILAPLALAVAVVAAALTLAGVELTILHLVGMLLIVAIGSNYALFFERHAIDDDGAMLGSLALANATTVIGFGLLASARVPVLRDLGITVAPGALLALAFSALLARGARAL